MAQQTAPSGADSGNRRNQVMVGELPGDFLRVGMSSQQQQCMQDERVAQVLQAQQQAGYGGVLPSNIRGKLGISIVQAKLTKNYGLTKMDPYCRLRVGHAVFETPTAYNGSKNPHWNKEVACYLPQGVDNMYVEIFDERSFTMDDRVAWAYVTLTESMLKGDTVDEWFPLSGRQGEEKEGMLNLVLTFTPMANLPPAMPMFQPVVYSYSTPAAGIYPGQQVPAQVPVPRGPLYTEEDMKQVKDMFPNMEEDVIQSVFQANNGNKDATINSLLQMSAD